MARRMGVTRQALGLWTSGKRTPDAKSLAVIADVGGVSVDYLLGRSTDGAEGIPAFLDLPPDAVRLLHEKEWPELKSLIGEMARSGDVLEAWLFRYWRDEPPDGVSIDEWEQIGRYKVGKFVEEVLKYGEYQANGDEGR